MSDRPQLTPQEIDEIIERQDQEKIFEYLEAMEEREYDKYENQIIKVTDTHVEIVDTDSEGKHFKKLVACNLNTEISRLADRKKLGGQERYMVQDILPCGQIHILSGPSGVGKTRWLTPFIKDWYEGKMLLGYQSFPEPYLYISCDRSGKSLNQTLRKLGLENWDLHYKTIADIQEEFGINDYNKMNLEDLIRYYPKIKVFFIEAIGWFQQLGNKVNQYAENLRYWVNIQRMVEKYDVTIIGTVHCPKSKPNDRHDNPRERVIGSVAMGAIVDTIFLLEFDDVKDVTNKNRVLRIMPRNVEASMIKYRMGDGGILLPMTDDELKEISAKEITIAQHKQIATRTKQNIMDSVLLMKKEQLTTTDLLKFADANEVRRSTVYNWIKEKLETGELIRLADGLYKKGRLV